MSDEPNLATPMFRAAVGVVGVGFAMAGGWSVATSLTAIGGLFSALDRSVYGVREILFLVVWLVFSLSLVVAALSLMRAAWAGHRRDIVPGPTLYVAGTSLVIIALFMLEAGALLPSALSALLGIGLMAAEYHSDVV